MKLENNYNCDFIKPLHRLASVLAMVPPYNSDGNTVTKYKCYSVFVSLIIFCAYMFTRDITTARSSFKSGPTFYIYNINYTLEGGYSIFAILISSFYNNRLYKSFVTRFREIDKYLTREHKPNKKCNQLLVELLLIHAVYLLLTGYSGWWMISKWGLYKFTQPAFSTFELYFKTIMVLLMFNYCCMIKQRFEKLNDRLKNSGKLYLVPNRNVRLIKEYSNTECNTLEFIKSSRKIYSQLTKVSKLFSKIFGWQILLILGVIGVEILELVNAELVMSLNLYGRITIYTYMCINVTMGIVLAVICDMTTKEAQRTATVCYNLLPSIPAVSNNVQDRIVREELTLLAQQATNQCPHFSAAGFFNVNYTMLFGLLGTVTSYIIVLIQINT